jgi:prepilin-type N-terminal cleavage/methylation domain-containing protein
MILATGKKKPVRSGSGFTLLEMLIVLAVIAMFTGVFMLRFDDGHVERTLYQTAVDIRGIALKSKKRSFAFRKNQYIVFTPKSFWTTETPPLEEGLAVASSGQGPESFIIPGDVIMEIKPPGSQRWINPKGHAWNFRASGLSDPMEVRFTMGRSYTNLNFNVLTGLAEEETILE